LKSVAKGIVTYEEELPVIDWRRITICCCAAMAITQRGIIYPIGLQAIFGYDDGKSWDFENDRIVIEGRTP